LKKLIIVLTIVVSISGCLPSLKISESEYKIFNLTQEIAESRDRDFFVSLPSNWFNTKDVNYHNNEIWLVHENYSAVIALKKIYLKSELKTLNVLENLLTLAKVDAELHKRKNALTFKLISVPGLYRNGNLSYSSFEYSFGKNQIARVVILEKNGNYFECIAYSTEKGLAKISLVELFSIQESLISSLNTN